MRRIGASVIERVTQACVCASMLLAPVAATQAATEEDPWEAVNRPIFRFNDTLDTYALKPLAKATRRSLRSSLKMASTTSSATWVM